MLLKKWTIQLIAGLFTLAICSNATATETKSTTETKPTADLKAKANDVPFTLHTEADNTDALAIPSDSTEDEINAEIEDLQDLQNPAKVKAAPAPVKEAPAPKK